MKELPYFKFYCNEWITGEITFLDYECQGLFINLCAFYWSKNGVLSLSNAKKRFRVREDKFTELIDSEIIKVSEDKITINFLDEQMNERGQLSKTNSKNGALGGRPKKQIESENKPTAFLIESEIKAKKSNIEEKREEEKRKEQYNNPKSIDFDKLLDYINSTFNKNFKSINDKAKKSFNARLKNYDKEIFITVINNLKKDSYHLETGFKYITPEYIAREKTIDLHSQSINSIVQNKVDNPFNLSPAQLESARIAQLDIEESIKRRQLENDTKKG